MRLPIRGLLLKGLGLSIGLWILTGFFRSQIPGTAYYYLHSLSDWLFLICGVSSAALLLKERLFGDRESSGKNIDRNTLAVVLLMLVGGILLLGGTEIYGRRSILTKEAIADANNSSAATSILGSPIRMRWIGSLSIRGEDGGIGGHESIRVKEVRDPASCMYPVSSVAANGRSLA
jgi:hypothetical protein